MIINVERWLNYFNNMLEPWKDKAMYKEYARTLFDVFNSPDSYQLPPAYNCWIRKHLVLNDGTTVSVQDSPVHHTSIVNWLPYQLEVLVNNKLMEGLNFNFIAKPDKDNLLHNFPLMYLIKYIIAPHWWINVEATLSTPTRYTKTINS